MFDLQPIAFLPLPHGRLGVRSGQRFNAFLNIKHKSFFPERQQNNIKLGDFQSIFNSEQY